MLQRKRTEGDVVGNGEERKCWEKKHSKKFFFFLECIYLMYFRKFFSEHISYNEVFHKIHYEKHYTYAIWKSHSEKLIVKFLSCIREITFWKFHSKNHVLKISKNLVWKIFKIRISELKFTQGKIIILRICGSAWRNCRGGGCKNLCFSLYKETYTLTAELVGFY